MLRTAASLLTLALALACQKSSSGTGAADARERLAHDVRTFARPRPPGSAGWRELRERLVERLNALGYRVELQRYGSGVNVIGVKPGSDPAAEHVLVSAHYDHIPGCAGADDNASGVAVLLELARRIAQAPRRRTLLLAFWDEEERGLLGSRAYAARARERGQRLALAVVLDAVGFSSGEPASQRVPPGFDRIFPGTMPALAKRAHAGDFLAVLANPPAAAASRRLAQHAERLGPPLVSVLVEPAHAVLLPDTLRSDHASFWSAGFAALLLTDTGDLRNPRYHCRSGPDTPDTLDYQFLERVTAALTSAVAGELGAR